MDDNTKDIRLKKFFREQVRQSLLKIGRKLVVEKGADFLTARKLSEAANASIGIIYNTFSNMDNFIAAQNLQTLDELYNELTTIIPEKNPYININRYADVFGNFVLNNRNLWMLLYKEQLFIKAGSLSHQYRRNICRFEKLLSAQLMQMFGNLTKNERKISLQVLGLSLFAISGFMAAEGKKLRKVNKNNLCLLLLNTYLAGLQSLKKVN